MTERVNIGKAVPELYKAVVAADQLAEQAVAASLSSPAELADLAADEGFVAKVNEAEASLRRYLESDLWFQQWGSQVSGGHVQKVDGLVRQGPLRNVLD